MSPSSASASGSVTPPKKTPLPDSCLILLDGRPQFAADELGVPIDLVEGARDDVLLGRVDRAGEGGHPLGLALGSALGGRHAASIIW